MQMQAMFLLFPSSFFQVSDNLQPRWGHSITAFCRDEGETEVTMFGGSRDPWSGSEKKQSKLADTTLMQFCEYINMLTHNMCNFAVLR